MPISDLLSPSVIRLELRAEDSRGVIVELTELLKQSGRIEHTASIVEAVLEREKRFPTGVGYGVALPHAAQPDFQETCVALGISRAGVDFHSPDGDPANIVFLLLFPEHDLNAHIRLLAEISRLLRQGDLQKSLMEADSVEKALAALREIEQRLEYNDEEN